MANIAASSTANTYCFPVNRVVNCAQLEMSCCSFQVREVPKSISISSYVVAGRTRPLRTGMDKQQVGLTRRLSRSQSAIYIRAAGPSDSSYSEREEQRWLREEQRWLREEQRWLREQARWDVERKAWADQSAALNNEITALRQEIESLQAAAKDTSPSSSTLSDLMKGLNSLLRSLRDAETVETRVSSPPPRISSSSSSSRKLDSVTFSEAVQVPVVASYITPLEVVKTVPPPDVAVPLQSESVKPKQEPVLVIKTRVQESPTPSEASSSTRPGPAASVKKRRTLKLGTEGDDVKALQEALAALGFYSGEDEMEDASFDTGTESAVKTWQSSVGAAEDGVLTQELLARLFGENPSASGSTDASDKRAAVTGVYCQSSPQSPPKAKGTAIKSKPKEGPAAGRDPRTDRNSGEARRVYLLGENRWEEPSRLVNRNGRGSPPAIKVDRCFVCKGAGSMMCTECEGTGELNVEEQFLDWVEEGAKCPYCEGSGTVKCDVCA